MTQTSSFCWKCQKEVDLPITFKAVCESCFAYLHSCRGCRFYSEGKPNDCDIPGTDPIRERDGMNYCEEFKPITNGKKTSGPSVEDVAKRLFGE